MNFLLVSSKVSPVSKTDRNHWRVVSGRLNVFDHGEADPIRTAKVLENVQKT